MLRLGLRQPRAIVLKANPALSSRWQPFLNVFVALMAAT